MAKMSPMWF
jgi:MATE family multidrug resistance protein